MPSKRYSLDEIVGPNGETRERLILMGIRAGGYAHVAAEAADLPARVFYRYLRIGRRKRAPERLRLFADRVRQALAQARLKVEVEVRENDPKFWLCHGPGRETSAQPGWTAATRPIFSGTEREVNPLESPEWARLWSLMLEALTPFPEARAALIAALGEPGVEASRER
jgi:hypothetical protein